MIIIKLKKDKEKKVKNLYPWIFKDETLEISGDKNDGELCNVFSSDYEFIGKGIYSNSNIACKMLTFYDEEINEIFFEKKIEKARKKRLGINSKFFRYIHAEADGLPGLIIDKYDDIYVLQIRNIGMEKFKSFIINILIKLENPKSIYERSDFETGISEDISRNVGIVYGKEIESDIIIEEHGIKYFVDIKKGQKTGFFFDQRDSRFFVRSLINKGDHVLDAHTYTGAFAFNMAYAGAEKVIALDKDKDSIEMAEKNKNFNNFENIDFFNTTFEEYSSNYKGKKFDLIVLDPPSMIKKKQERKKGVELFKSLVEKSSYLLKEDGIMGLCSCAYQADIDLLIESTRKAYFNQKKEIQVIGITYQSCDHPWVIQIPESLYLKCLWFKI
jgi:23S rRNA (cytosine1962-C5)-methyltransferase